MMDDQLNGLIQSLDIQDCILSIESENSFNISTKIEGRDIELICIIPSGFPYTFPMIKIKDESYDQLEPIPHIYTNKSICLFDKSKVIPNFLQPERMLQDTIKKAIEVIRQGMVGENLNDYYDEFNEYWSNSSIANAECFLPLGDEPRDLKCFLHKSTYYISDCDESLKNILKKVIYSDYKEEFEDCIYIPLDKAIIPPYPKTNKEFYNIIKKSSLYFNKYKKFVEKNFNRLYLILFSQKIKNEMTIQGWIHTRIDVPHGFRKGNVKLDLALMGKTGDKDGFKIKVEVLDQQRLFNRGGKGLSSHNLATTIVGCGSLGSYLVEGLALSGVNSFNLIDNEILKYENIARHTCGYFYEGLSKVNAIKFDLEKRNPNIECDSYFENCFSFLEKEQNIDKINKSDLICVAVGNLPLEYYIMKLHEQGRITKPLMIIWIEPYAICGHAIIINNQQNVFKELYDPNDFKFKYNVVINGDKYLKREAGCQSTFMPYSGFDVKLFIYHLLDYYFNDHQMKKKNGNYCFIWFGAISNTLKSGIEIYKEYLFQDDYSTIIKRFD